MHIIEMSNSGVLTIMHDYIVYRDDSIRLDFSFDEFADELSMGFKTLPTNIVENILDHWDEISLYAIGYSELSEIMLNIAHACPYVREAIAIHGGPEAQEALLNDSEIEVRRALATYTPMNIKACMAETERDEDILRLLAALGDETTQMKLVDNRSTKVRTMLAISGSESVQMKLIVDRRPVVINALRSFGSQKVCRLIDEMYGEGDAGLSNVKCLSETSIPTLADPIPNKEVSYA